MNNKINKILLIYWHDERNLNLRKLVYSIHTFIFNHIFAWFWFHYVVVYYSTRNHYMLFIVSVSVFFASSLYLDFRILDITLTMFTLDFTFIPQRIRLVVLRYRYHNLSSISWIWIIMLQTWPHHIQLKALSFCLFVEALVPPFDVIVSPYRLTKHRPGIDRELRTCDPGGLNVAHRPT
jgi:hypothetical protein